MEKTFDHLLGLSARSALAILTSYGITDVRVTLTGAPPMHTRRVPACPITEPDAQASVSALASISRQFSAGEDEDDLPAGFDPLLDPELDDGMLVESRVVAVREDGRQLIVARFHIGEPKSDVCNPR